MKKTILTSPLSAIIALLRRLPFTLLLLAAVVLVAYWTDAPLESLAKEWVRRLGFSAHDLWALNLERLATSAVATHGGPVFWRALLALLAIVGLAEWRTGTLRTFIVFSSSHVLTLVALAILVGLGLRTWHPPLAELLETARDVGPSAGYFGCLALLCRSWDPTMRRLSGAAILLGLALTLVWELRLAPPIPIAVSAALAHVLAFPIGWFMSSFLNWTLRRFSKVTIDPERRTRSSDQPNPNASSVV